MNTSQPAPSRPITWWPLLVFGGLLVFVGGGMHGDPAGPDLPIRQNLATTMEAGGWVLGHAIMTVGAALIAGGVWIARREAGWQLSRTLWRVLVVAVALNAIELVVHTAVIVEKDGLLAGETGLLTAVHLAGLLIVYPLYGLAVAAVAAVRFRAAGIGHRAIAALGIVGGVCHAVSAPLAVATESSAFEFLFPLAGVTVSAWWIGTGISARPRRAAAVPATAS